VGLVSRIPGADPATADASVRRVLEAQAKLWGAPLANHLVYARRPTLFRAFRAVWNSLNHGAILDEKLVALLNRRVAGINGCHF
jgi:alkylhydroperoxidase family enzyme